MVRKLPWQSAGLPIPPEEKIQRRKVKRIRIVFCILSGIMIGAAFPPSRMGILACFGLVPLLVVLSDIPDIGEGLRYTYLTMLVVHIITLNWTGGYVDMKDPYMMVAGAFVMVVHPLFFFLPVGGYLYVRRKIGSLAALSALPFLWVAFEYCHSLTQWSFPWLTIGNTQTYDLPRIQFISVTGVYGLSFWVITLNVLAFLLYGALSARKSRGRIPRVAWWLAASIIVLFELPLVYGLVVVDRAQVDGAHPAMDRGSVTVGMIQPNIDPWEKWNHQGYDVVEEQMRMTEDLVRRTDRPRPQIVLWSETAVPYFLLVPANRWLVDALRARLAREHIALLTGLPQMLIYPDSTKAPRGAKLLPRTRQRYDTFNAAALLQPGMDSVQWYGKMKLVPFAERIPYAEVLSFVEFLRWDVGLGGWQVGQTRVVFHDSASQSRFSTAICYESVYPGFIAGFVRGGAEFLTIITIDSWWDHMSGAYQHERFAVLRAVENRRWIARCAVGGISCYIDPFGRVYDETALFTKAECSRTIGRSSELTYYSAHGDVWAKSCTGAAFLALALSAGWNVVHRKRLKGGML